MRRTMSCVLVLAFLVLAPAQALATPPGIIHPFYTSFARISSALRFETFYAECDWIIATYSNTSDTIIVDAKLQVLKNGLWEQVTTFYHVLECPTTSYVTGAVSRYYFPAKGDYRLVSTFTSYKNGQAVESDTLFSYASCK